jgi:hypothetical protein
MCKQESLVCHLPNYPETTKREDREGYQTDKALVISSVPMKAEQAYPEYPVLSVSESASHTTDQPHNLLPDLPNAISSVDPANGMYPRAEQA